MPFAVFAFAAFILYAIFSIVNDMAIARGQNPWPWLFLALVWSPFGSMFVLWMFYDV
ncbi:hypothetical protein OE699_02085 [Sedimentimonas flavescens]|uniref:Uncharacterized protein n=1 Tax=Sedimentimonas flavescens TaxID=2851012 RepID=A0ABT2ZVT7_9RHOB|nr:hypothetical protein [Sedimentimonas flavescens]MCV2877629.1 hypothetical protein [Sedimentimonas flavescens]